MTTWEQWKDKLIWGVVAGGISALLAWSAWATLTLLERPTRAEIIGLIDVHSPYVEDRRVINETLVEVKDLTRQLKGSIDNNTQAIVRLQTFLEKSNNDGEF